MLRKTIEHSVRRISFEVDEAKEWTSDDERLINAFVGLHDRDITLHKQKTELLHSCGNLKKHIDSVREELGKVKEDIEALSKYADSFSLMEPGVKQFAEESAERTNTVNDIIQDYHSLMGKLESEMTELADRNCEFIDETESMDAWDGFEEVKGMHYDNYETNSIDIVTFDDEDDSYRDAHSIWNKANETAIDHINETIADYNKLLLETEMQYAIWSQVAKRLALIRTIAENKAGEFFVSSN